MSIETAIKTELETDATLSGLSVSVYPHVAPQSADYPFIVYSVQSTDIENYLNKSPSDLTLTEISVDLSVYSDSASIREQIGTRIKNLLHGFSGDLGTENLNIRKAVLQSLSTFSESDLTGTDQQIYRASLQITFFYNWS